MADEAVVASGKKRRLMIIGVGGVLVVACVAFAAKILLDDSSPPAKPAAVAQAPKPAAAASKPAASPSAEAPKPAADASKPAATPPSAPAAPAAPAAGAPAAPAAAAAKPAAGKPVAGPEAAARGKIVIPGGYHWDAKTNSLGSGGDLQWQHRNEKERSLSPGGRAMLAITEQNTDFDAMGAADLIKLQYSSTPVPGSDGLKGLDPGAVLGMRTVDGDYLKVRVARYYDSADFSFPGGDKLPPKWRELQKAKGKIDRFSVELDWVAYPGPAIAAAKGEEARRAAAEAAKPIVVSKPAPEAPAAPAKVAEAAPPMEAEKGAAQPAEKEARPVPVVARPARPEPPSLPGPRYADVMTAVLYRDSQGLAEVLSFGKWVDKTDSKGKTPLMVAVSMDDAGLATQLLDAGADASRGMSVAREFRNQKMQALMMKYGAK